MSDKIMLSGEYEGLSLRSKTFTTKEWNEIKSLSWTLEISGNIPDWKYYVNVYKNKEKKSENSPDYTLYLKPAEAKAESVKGEEDDF